MRSNSRKVLLFNAEEGKSHVASLPLSAGFLTGSQPVASASPSPPASSGPNTGAIAGGVVGAVAAAIVAGELPTNLFLQQYHCI